MQKQNMSDDEIDKLFKEAAEGFKAPSDSSAWQDMSSRLDQSVGTSAFWNWKTVSTLAVVGVTSMSLVWFAWMKESEQPLSEKVASTQAEGNESKSSQPAASNATESSAGSHDLVSKESDRSTSNQIQAINSTQSVDNEVASVEPTHEKVEADHSITSDQQSLNKRQEEDVAIISVKNSNQESSPVSTDSLAKVTEEEKIQKDSELSDPVKEKPEEKKVKTGAGVSIKLAIASDFSSVNYFSSDKPGFNYGALVGYSFNNRWSVFTGAISSRKIYSSSDIDKSYTTSAGYPYEVNELEGDCRVLDIPLNVYYTFFPDRSFSIQAGLGFSSYLMFNEKYTYHVDNPYGRDIYHQEIDHENNEWFKMLNVSVILQKRLSNHMYFEFEPFLKAPLAGVGEGEVSLVSLGAFLNLRYDIPLNKP